jgi:hypothetical protein
MSGNAERILFNGVHVAGRVRDMNHATGSLAEPTASDSDCAVLCVRKGRLAGNVGKSLVYANFFTLGELDMERSEV